MKTFGIILLATLFFIPTLWGAELLFIDFENTSFIDKSQYNHTITALGSVSLSNTDARFGSKSGYFQGGYLTINNSGNRLNFDINTYTIEFWIKPLNLSQQYIVHKDTYWYDVSVETMGDGGGIYRSYKNPANNWTITGGAGKLQLNQWNHMAAVRNGSTQYLFINGVLVNMAFYSGSFTSDAGNLYIGRNYVESGDLQAYLDDIHIVDTALYTTNFNPNPNPIPEQQTFFMLILTIGIAQILRACIGPK